MADQIPEKTALQAALSAMPSTALASENTQDPQVVLHSNLVKSALLNDAYGKRCRGRSVAKYFSQVNRLFITKYSTSVNNYIDTYIASDYRSYKVDFEHQFSRVLAQKGGCDQAKEQQWDKQMLDEFKDLFSQAESAEWYPTIERY
ncbi:hypothetical protein THMIRHAS_14940 [Thiosulfatimonas sediminis]|uniref:Uncharacterized protein n=2 Tax=Thiosulfatimonas sediminis TaxID=2675054 RepID=A0A6F8PVG4_9GAMM|nr:hypothetical protein THMIRHAS_14940 [Thiosulfatimonas sediminis]